MKKILIIVLSMTVFQTASYATTHQTRTDRRIAQLKREILFVGSSASRRVKYDNDDNDPRVRAKLDVLVQELVKIAPVKTQAEKLNRVVGAWKSVWSDLNYFGGSPLVDSVYQVVFPTGYYYNIANFDSPLGKYASIGKGEFRVTEPALRIKFVKFGRNSKLFKRGTDLATIGMRAELGEYDEVLEQSPALGFESDFEQIYVDEDIRIGAGLNRDGKYTLFILKRATQF